MEIPCIRVPRVAGEAVRQELAAAGLIDREFRISSTEEWVYIPVRTDAELPTEYSVEYCNCEPKSRQLLPGDFLDEEPTYERLGDIALIDEDDPDRAERVAAALMDSSIPVKTVLNRVSKIEGEYRVREWEILAGEATETVHREFGMEFLLDVTTVYFSPRLATERHRVVSQVTAGEQVIDMFAGVGPFAIPMAARGAEVVGVDLNPEAIAYLRENARRNQVSDRIKAIHADSEKVAASYPSWADRLVMNLPHRANEFLHAAKQMAGETCRLHYYDIQPDEDPFTPGYEAIRSVFEPAYDVSVVTRRTVRSYAPHKVNVCLDVDVSQG